MPWGAVAGAVISGAMASDAAGDAADAQQKAARDAADLQREQFNKQIELQKPWYDAGKEALGYYAPLVQPGGEFNRNFTLADFQADPGYGYRLAQGQKALENSATAKGLGQLSGNMINAQTQLGQNMASDEYQRAYARFVEQQGLRANRLANLANVGGTASTNLAGQAGQMGANLGSLALQSGNAQAAGITGANNAWGSAIGTAAPRIGQAISNWYGNQQTNPNYTPYGESSAYNNAFDYGGGISPSTGGYDSYYG